MPDCNSMVYVINNPDAKQTEVEPVEKLVWCDGNLSHMRIVSIERMYIGGFHQLGLSQFNSYYLLKWEVASSFHFL